MFFQLLFRLLQTASRAMRRFSTSFESSRKRLSKAEESPCQYVHRHTPTPHEHVPFEAAFYKVDSGREQSLTECDRKMSSLSEQRSCWGIMRHRSSSCS